MMTEDEKYMNRCLRLASNGIYGAAPNPMVGAVIVHNGRIIGEGYHARCGEAHAEVNAIRSVKDPAQLKDSTIYVSLEPCSHYGKTPPCADLIIEKKIARVVVGCVDPFSEVSGRGIEKIRAAGIDVKVGVLENECLDLNRRFLTFHLLKRPYITLKWAQSADGFMDLKREQRGSGAYTFSTPQSMAWMHQARATHQAILVGANTAVLDNPSLTNRLWGGNQPLRIVLDGAGRLPKDLRLFTDGLPTRVYVDKTAIDVAYEGASNVKVIRIDCVADNIQKILNDLYELNIQSLLVEGGANVLGAFIDNKLWDEVRVESSNFFLKEGVQAPQIPNEGITSESKIDENNIISVRLNRYKEHLSRYL